METSPQIRPRPTGGFHHVAIDLVHEAEGSALVKDANVSTAVLRLHGSGFREAVAFAPDLVHVLSCKQEGH